MTEQYQGIKNIEIHARGTYPVVTAFEFEFLKTEAVVQAILKPSTIYFIVQRPLIFFHNLRIENGLLTFEITDNKTSAPLICSFDPGANGFSTDGEDLLLDIQFYKRVPDTSEPFNNVAGIKLHKVSGDFLFWLTPQNFIHHVLIDNFIANISGDIFSYIDYKILYIGKAFSQDVWNRLTGHDKMQSILTKEAPLDSRASNTSFEISLILLDIIGFSEACIFPCTDIDLQAYIKPIVHKFNFEDDNDLFDQYYNQKLDTGALQLTNEVESMLVSQFKPLYNQVMFNNYPNIEQGTRSAGYTQSSLILESLPAILFTDHFRLDQVLNYRP